jgi:hypothetical protein
MQNDKTYKDKSQEYFSVGMSLIGASVSRKHVMAPAFEITLNTAIIYGHAYMHVLFEILSLFEILKIQQ